MDHNLMYYAKKPFKPLPPLVGPLDPYRVKYVSLCFIITI